MPAPRTAANSRKMKPCEEELRNGDECGATRQCKHRTAAGKSTAAAKKPTRAAQASDSDSSSEDDSDAPPPRSTRASARKTLAKAPIKTTAGKTTAGKTTAGKTTAGKTTAGKTTAGKTTAGKTTAGKTTAKKSQESDSSDAESEDASSDEDNDDSSESEEDSEEEEPKNKTKTPTRAKPGAKKSTAKGKGNGYKFGDGTKKVARKGASGARKVTAVLRKADDTEKDSDDTDDTEKDSDDTDDTGDEEDSDAEGKCKPIKVGGHEVFITSKGWTIDKYDLGTDDGHTLVQARRKSGKPHQPISFNVNKGKTELKPALTFKPNKGGMPILPFTGPKGGPEYPHGKCPRTDDEADDR